MKNKSIKEWKQFKEELEKNIITTKENNKENKDIYNTMLSMLKNIKIRKKE
jgi:hypothetical protein